MGPEGSGFTMQATIQHWSQHWTRGGVRIRWGAIFAGLAVGIAIQMVFTLLGLERGQSTYEMFNRLKAFH
jgi:hypothetical protein